MGPEQLEAVVREIAKRHGAEVTIIAGDDLLVQGFPAIHAVGRASHRAPRLIELSWGDRAHPAIALVGKGVCRSAEHTSELQSLMRISSAASCFKKKNNITASTYTSDNKSL